MTDWVPLDANTLALPKHRTIRGVDITLVTSPYDIPEAVRGDYNKELHRFVIEFRYMSDEPLEVTNVAKILFSVLDVIAVDYIVLK